MSTKKSGYSQVKREGSPRGLNDGRDDMSRRCAMNRLKPTCTKFNSFFGFILIYLLTCLARDRHARGPTTCLQVTPLFNNVSAFAKCRLVYVDLGSKNICLLTIHFST